MSKKYRVIGTSLERAPGAAVWLWGQPRVSYDLLHNWSKYKIQIQISHRFFFIKIQGDCDKFRSVPLVQQFDSEGDPVSVTALQSVQQIWYLSETCNTRMYLNESASWYLTNMTFVWNLQHSYVSQRVIMLISYKDDICLKLTRFFVPE